MSKIAAWLVLPDSDEPQRIDAPFSEDVLVEIGERYFGGSVLDLTKVQFRGRLCHMAVDDEGLCKGLPINRIATAAYHANCRPGTTNPIVGPAVIFGGLLP